MIEIIPEIGADPNKNYLAGIRIDGTVENVQGQTPIPGEDQKDTLFITLTSYVLGDADGGGDLNIGDAIYIVKYVFVPDSPPPCPCEAGDADCSGDINIGDALYLVRHIFLVDEEENPYPAPCPPIYPDENCTCE